MTLCIAARATVPSPASPRIVLCFDYKLAGDEWGSESEYKFQVLSEELVSLYAGAPGAAKELATTYQEHLKKEDLSQGDVLNKLKVPLAAFKRSRGNAYIGSKLGLSYEEFLQNGRNWFGDDLFERWVTAIATHQPRIELIIAGFVNGAPLLYRVTRGPGPADWQIEPESNLLMIGTGAYTAEPAIHARRQDFNTPLSQTLYNAYEAKKVGELSPYVGQKTRMYILAPPELGSRQIKAQVVMPEGERWLARLYKRYGPKPMKTWPDIPKDALMEATFSRRP